ncbi:MAG: radical SAM protein [Nitrospiraceae bacterium]|nr:radical SAM protein [Nitrospiraceae bacterium]
MEGATTFRLVLIRPSHYDDDGYVIQWVRSAIPSNTLATLNSLAMDCARRQVLGKDVGIVVDCYDETNTVLPIKSIIRTVQKAAAGMVALVGVQSNQFPRAVDLATSFLQADISVVIGGFHVSGCLRMLPDIPVDIQAALNKGIAIFAGEAEGRLDLIVRDAYHGRLKKVYNFMDDLPGLQGTPTPFLDRTIIDRTFGRMSSFDAGRGCPFQCSFCTIINVQGRKSRWRSPDDIEAVIRSNLRQGVRRFFITDDDFARNKNWEAILDRLIVLREDERLPISFTIQVDTQCHKIPRFIEKAARAGCRNVFIGLESINPDALIAAKKRQNKIWGYRKMLQAWKDHGCTTIAGYILGFPQDTPGSIAQDIEIIKRELPIDMLEFFYLTPLPGSEDHQTLTAQGVWMDSDMNKYDLEHVTTAHSCMSEGEWSQVYKTSWRQYYTLEHIETVLRRAAAKRLNMNKLMYHLLWFSGSTTIDKVHPLEWGVLRRKVRKQRRCGMLFESPFIFYPRRVWQVTSTCVRWAFLVWTVYRIRCRVENASTRLEYIDTALTPVADQEEGSLDLMQVHADSCVHPHITKQKAAIV